MPDRITLRTAAVTGANSGLGFETAGQLAEAGLDLVVLLTRSAERGEQARMRLVERTSRDPFLIVPIDTTEVASAEAAAEQLRHLDRPIDAFFLNAGASAAEPRPNALGVEMTYASTLLGHHVLAARSTERGIAAEHARFVISGSEAALGRLPGMHPHDLRQIADRHYGGDVESTILDLVRLRVPGQERFANMNEYATAKRLVVWWAASMARRLPTTMAVNAVSPGANSSTAFARDASFVARRLMFPMMRTFGGLVGMNGPTADGARRYIDVATSTSAGTGNFYATAHHRRLVGPMAIQTEPGELLDKELQDATLAAMESLTGVAVAASAA